VESSAEIKLSFFNISLDPTAGVLEGSVGLELGREQERCSNVKFTPVSPESDNSLRIELGFNISSVNVGNDLSFISNSWFFFASLSLEFDGFLSTVVESRSLSGILEG